MRPRVYITRALPTEALGELPLHCDYTCWPESELPVPRDVLLKEAEHADGLLTMLTDQIDDSLLKHASRLRVVSNLAVGYDNIDIGAAKERGIAVCNTPDVLTESTADLTFALMLATARRLVEAADYVKRDKWTSWSPSLLTGMDVYNKTLGIVGLGRIGIAVARRASGFGMQVVYNSRTQKLKEEQALNIRFSPLDQLLCESDFVCVLTPLSDATKNLIGPRELSLMKPSSVLINTARGGVVDESALYEALCQGEIWGAGLDVFSQEPLRANHPLLALPNVIAIPHIGSATIETRHRMARLAADNLWLALSGREGLYRVV